MADLGAFPFVVSMLISQIPQALNTGDKIRGTSEKSFVTHVIYLNSPIRIIYKKNSQYAKPTTYSKVYHHQRHSPFFVPDKAL